MRCSRPYGLSSSRTVAGDGLSLLQCFLAMLSFCICSSCHTYSAMHSDCVSLHHLHVCIFSIGLNSGAPFRLPSHRSSRCQELVPHFEEAGLTSAMYSQHGFSRVGPSMRIFGTIQHQPVSLKILHNLETGCSAAYNILKEIWTGSRSSSLSCMLCSVFVF